MEVKKINIKRKTSANENLIARINCIFNGDIKHKFADH